MKIRITTAFYLSCVVPLLMLATTSFGQLTRLWENHYVSKYDSNLVYITDGSPSFYGNKLQFDASGNCYFLSEVVPPSTNNQIRMNHPRMQVIKYNPSGATLWIHTDTGNYYHSCDYCGLYTQPYQMIVHNDGTFFSLASESGDWLGYYSLFLASTKSTGITTWDTSMLINQYLSNMAEDYKGNLGIVANSNANWSAIALSKISSTGNILWSVLHTSPDGNNQNSYPKVTTDNVGNFYTINFTYHTYINPTIANVWITKFDTSGSLIWEKKLDSGTTNLQEPDLLYNKTDNCVYASYAIVPNDTFYNRYAKLAKITTSGNIQWMKSESTVSGFTRIKQDNQGNVYLWSGDQDYGSLPYPDKTNEEDIFKYNSAGIELGHMYGNSFDIDASGYTYTTNYFFDPKTYYRYDDIRKYSANGTLLYEVSASLTNDDNYISEVYLNNSTNLYTLKQYHNFDTVSVTKYNATCSATAVPAKPKTITGSAVMTCDGSTSYTYSIAAVANANYYNWTVPVGVTINAGQGTNKIYVVNNSTFKTGTISVYAANCYGASAAISKAVNDTLKIPGAITGPASVCKGQTYVQYNVAAVAGANDYEWTVPANASIVCGNHTNSICVSFGNNGGTLTVTAYNSCGTASPVRSKQIKVTACIAGMTVEAEENKATIYPNPSSGAFTLRLGNAGKNYNQSVVSVMVKDVSGKVVEEIKSVTAGSVSFGSRLVPGVYFVEVITGSEKQVLKVVKE